MKGVFFQKPLEFKLHVEGESWRQGDEIAVELLVKNHGSESINTDDLVLILALGTLKKVREKSSEAYQEISSAKWEEKNSIPTSGEHHLKWKFKTDINCPITDTIGSLFILYGKRDSLEKLGQLQLVVNPHAEVDEFLSRLNIQHRFVVKSKKYKKGSVDVKLDPPSSRAYLTLEQLLINFKKVETGLKINYQFQVKKVEATAATLDVKKQGKTLDQELSRSDLYLASGRFNHDKMEEYIRAALDLVEQKVNYT